MTCRWVADSRLTTFGRRVVITSAVFGLTTIGSAGAALAAPGDIGHSPANPVVAKAPTAVSVTFNGPLRSGGARMRVLSSGSDVGVGEVTTAQKTLRRELRSGAPAGPYVVEWRAVSAKGKKMSGRFGFTAARSNAEVDVKSVSPVPSPPTVPPPSPEVTVSAEPAAPGSPAPGSPSPASSLGAPSLGAPSLDASSLAVSPSVTTPSSPTRTGTPEWITGPDPVWTPAPTETAAALAGGSDDAGRGSSVATGFTAVPLAMGGLLVLVAGLISVLNRPRLRG